MNQDEFVAYMAILIDEQFPKATSHERPQAMILVGDIAWLLTKKGLLTGTGTK